MHHTRIKVCGITRAEDARHCEAAGVDAIGFVFVAKSKRRISTANARLIAERLGPFVTRVGLFLNPTTELVEEALTVMPDLLLQFHGTETGTFCDSFERPYIKAIGVGSGMPTTEILSAYSQAAGFLFDSNEAGQLGGTGHTFDWGLLKNNSDKPLILAGGLDVRNIARAIDQVQPYAVDVSTGVEVSPGVKDTRLIDQFVASVTRNR